jgi:glycosyltransferase involved in cell wall biosynthesis
MGSSARLAVLRAETATTRAPNAIVAALPPLGDVRRFSRRVHHGGRRRLGLLRKRYRRWRSGTWPPPCPGADIEEPDPGARVDRLSAVVRGWAMFPAESVSRVEISVDGRPVGLARLGLPRTDVAALCGCSDAPISGWELELATVPDLPAGRPVTLACTAFGSKGGKAVSPSVAIHMKERGRVPEVGPSRVVRAPRVPQRLDVLVFTHSLTYGGAQLYLAELLERLTRRECRFTVLSGADGPLRGRLEEAGVDVHVSPGPALWEHHAYDERVDELVAFAGSRKLDLVVVNTIGMFHGLEVAARLGLPSILAAHESLDAGVFWSRHLWPHDPAIFERLRGALASATATVFEAAATRELFLPYADPARLLTLPYGIDLGAVDRFRARVTRDAARSALGIDLDRRLVLCLGTIEHRKAQASLARAFGRVSERFPDALLALVGRLDEGWTASYAAGLYEHLLRAGMLEAVLVRPLTPDPFLWHTAADVLVCASDNESMPRVILEAMAFGTPVVATDVFGIPEVVEDGVTGFLVRARDEGEIVEVLTRVLAAPDGHREVCAAASEVVRRRHDADAYAERFRGLM